LALYFVHVLRELPLILLSRLVHRVSVLRVCA